MDLPARAGQIDVISLPGDQMQPHVNPVSTAFALQALTMWRQFLSGELEFSTDALI